MVRVVDIATERTLRRSSEDFADVLALSHGGIAICSELGDGVDFVWEFDREQARVFIDALSRALNTGQSVRVVQPIIRQVSRRRKRFHSSLC